MIEIQLVPFKHLSAVLAGISVALENVVPRKFHFLFWKSLEKQEHNDPRNADAY